MYDSSDEPAIESHYMYLWYADDGVLTEEEGNNVKESAVIDVPCPLLEDDAVLWLNLD